MDQFVVLIGAVALLRGLQYIASPAGMKAEMRRWMKMDDLTYRAFGLFGVLVGAFIILIGL